MSFSKSDGWISRGKTTAKITPQKTTRVRTDLDGSALPAERMYMVTPAAADTPSTPGNRRSPSGKQIKRSMTDKEIDMRRELQGRLVGKDGQQSLEDFILSDETQKTGKNNPHEKVEGEAFETELDKAATAQVRTLLLPGSTDLTPDERTAIAACFVRAAIERKPLSNVDWRSARARKLYLLRHSRTWLWIRRIAFTLLNLVVVWEPAATHGSPIPPSHWAAVSTVELLCALVFTIDGLAQLLCTTLSNLLNSASLCAHTLLVTLLLSDSIINIAACSAGSYTFRFSRVLRPLLLPTLSRTCLHMAMSVLRSLPSLADIFVVIMTVLMFYTLLGLALFGRNPAERAAEYEAKKAGMPAAISNVTYTTLEPGSVEWMLSKPLESLSTTLIELTIALFTADNYPHIMYQSFICKETACGAVVGTVFFISLVVIGHVILMSVFVAVIFEVYKRQHAFLVLHEKVIERHALLAAFKLLDLTGDRRLSRKEFTRLLKAVRPGIDDDSESLTFSVLDANHSDTIDCVEFLEATHVLMLNVPRKTTDKCGDWIQWQWPWATRIVEQLWFDRISDLSVLLYITLLLLFATGEWSASALSALEAIDFTFVVYFTLEVIIKTLGKSIESLWGDTWSAIDAIVVVLSWVSLALEAAFLSHGDANSLRSLRLLRLLRLGRLFRVFGKVVNSTMKTKVLTATFSRFGRIILPMIGVLLMLVYSFAVVGMELLQGALDPNYSRSLGGDFCAPFCPSFNTVETAWLTLFQMLIGANWSALLSEAAGRQRSFGSSLFIMLFVILCHVMMLSSLLVALVLEVYACEMERATQQQAEDKMSVLCMEMAPVKKTTETGKKLMTILTASVREKFSKYDLDKSGALQLNELEKLMNELNPEPLTPEQINNALDDIDEDRSGMIEFDEFLPWWRRRCVMLIFKKHDADSSGTIDAKELPYVMEGLGLQLSPAQEAAALKELDTDESGCVSFEEYVKWFEQFDMQLEFEKYDKDSSGSINKREFRKLTLNLGLNLSRKELDHIFTHLDDDNNGTITFEEFHPWWRSVKSNTKNFMMSYNGGRDEWEEELFLKQHDMADVRVKQRMNTIVNELEKDFQKSREMGNELTAEKLLMLLKRETMRVDVDKPGLDAESVSQAGHRTDRDLTGGEVSNGSGDRGSPFHHGGSETQHHRRGSAFHTAPPPSEESMAAAE